MTAPDAKAVEAALRDLDAAHRCIGSHTFAPDTMQTLEDAARAYLRAPTAPQGAEPVNQCDGCRRGLALDRDIHRDASGLPVMGCTAHLYAAPAVPREDQSPRITFTLEQAKRLVEWFGDDNDPDAEITVAHFPAGKIVDDDGKPEPAGLYCWFTDYPDEGSLPLFDAAIAAPAPDKEGKS